MTFEKLLELVQYALNSEIDPILKYCEPYYSPYYQLMYLVSLEMTTEATMLPITKPLCIELGVESGRGSFSMLQAMVQVIGIDNNPDRKDVLNDNPNFKILICSSHPPPDLVKSKGEQSISLLHIDTEHSENWAREEFMAYKPYLKDGAVVLFDDTNAMDGGVRRFVESLPYDKFFEDRLHPGCGYGGILYKVNI
jgi:hypothetical protein